jgi:hypothetical protein
VIYDLVSLWQFSFCLISIYLGVNSTAKIGVSGDSAGGMISASLGRTLKNIDFQVDMESSIVEVD